LPAQSCGIVGLKPTRGRVSRQGVFPLSPSLDHIGPFTRSAEDAAILLGAIAGADPNDPSSLSAPVPDYLGECSGGLAGLRIGVDPAYIYKGSHANVVAAFGEVEGTLVAAGAYIRGVAFPAYRDAIRCWTSILQIEAAHSHRETFPARAKEYGPALAGMLELGRAKPVAEVAETLIAREVFANGLATIFRDVDLLMIPVTPAGAPTKEEVRNLSGTFLEEFIKYTAPFNLSGYPTITVPAGEDRNGMPIGMQFVGPPLSEPLLCRAGAAFQRLTDWHTRHPPERG
jgi:amidase